MRAVCLGFAAALFASVAFGEPNVPQIAESALAYRASIESIRGDLTAVQVLSAIRRAESVNQTAGLLRLYEQLVSLDRDNFRAWLQLGLAWREAEPFADKGLAAAYQAYGATQAAGEQLEALLLMSSLLRTRLDRYRNDYEAARREQDKAEILLLNLNNGERRGDIVGLNPNDPIGNLRLLTQTRDNARRAAAQALQQITRTVSELDEIYREIAAKASTVSAAKLKADDARSAVFTVVTTADPGRRADYNADNPATYNVPRVDYQIDGSKVNACLDFTQELNSGDQSYKRFVEVKLGEDPVSAYAVEAKGHTLCISGLDPGIEYAIKLLPDLPSRLGAKLKGQIALPKVRLPDLPAQIAFSGRNFILPASGPGEIPLYITNLERFELQIFRITDRTLHRQIALGHIGGTLPPGEYADLRDRFAEAIWSGSMELKDPKPNVVTRAFLEVRSILNQRSEWLRRQIEQSNKDQAEFVSPRVAVPVQSAERLSGTGQYFAGAPSFEKGAATADLKTPSIYALVTRDLADTRKRKRSECEDDCAGYLAQWFITTDIGLTFFEGDQQFTVIARSLRSGTAKTKTRIELVSAGNRVLASGETDDNGVISFPISLTRGTQSNQLVALLAYQGDDFSFLSYGSERLDLSRLNVDGRPLSNGFNGFLTTDRGIYQPEDTVRLLTLIRDPRGVAPENAPHATVRLEARDRVLVQKRLVPQDWALGGALVPVEIPKNMRAGTARLTLSVGKGNEALVGETMVQVGPVRPDRARLQFVDPKTWQVRKSANGVAIAGPVSAQYLFAAKATRQGAAGDLKAEMVVRVAAGESPVRECYGDFLFGRFDDKPIPVSSRHFIEYTDREGNLNLRLSGIDIPAGTRPLAATVEVTLFDASGPLASRSMAFPIAEDQGWIGIAKAPTVRAGTRPGTYDIGVDLVSITADNKPAPGRSFDVRLEREREFYVWERRDDSWQHVKSVRREPLSQRSITIAAPPAPSPDGNCVPNVSIAQLAEGLDVGRYVLTVSDPQANGRESAIRFQIGVAATSPDQLEPNIFTLYTSKPVYRAGEPIELTAAAPFDGELLVAFADGDIRRWASGQVRNGTAKISLPAPREWEGQGLYALATVFRSGADGTVVAGPARSIGAAHFEVRGAQAGYGAAIELLGNASQGYIAPGESLSFKVCVTDSAGACSKNPPTLAYAAGFIVDEGLLSLTGHHDVVPDPERHFYGRKRFALRIMDNYNRLLLKEGGDRPTRLALSNYTSVHIVSLAQGPVKLENGSATFNIGSVDLQNGAASIFVVVWSKDYAAATTKDVNVRSSVVADIDAPPFLYAGDRAILPLRLENIDFIHPEFNIKLAASGPVAGVALFAGGAQPPPGRPSAEFRVALPQGAPKTIYVAVETTPEARGTAKLDLAIEAVGSPVPLGGHRYAWKIELRAPVLTSVDTVTFPLGREATNLRALIQNLISDYDADRTTVTVHFSDDVRSLLTASADLKPERTPIILGELVWRGLLLLHAAGPPSEERRQELQRMLAEIQSMQTPAGSFVPYRTVGDYGSSEFNAISSLLPTVSVLDLLSLASSAGYEVSEQSLRAARQFVETALGNVSYNERCGLELAYGWLVLMRLRPVNYDKIRRLENCAFDTLSAQAAAAAALSARFGLSDQARVMLAQFQQTTDPDELKDFSDIELAMMLTFLVEAGAPPELVKVVADVLFKRTSLSKEAMAWSLRAGAEATAAGASRLALEDLQVSGAPRGVLRLGQGGVIETAQLPYRQLQSISVALRRNIAARGLLTIEGPIARTSALKRLPQDSLKRRFFNLDTGEEINPAQSQLRIGDRLAVVIEGNERAAAAVLGSDRKKENADPLLLAQLLPSAFQIVSTNLFGQRDFALGGALKGMKAIGSLRSVESDPDRWLAVITPQSTLDAQTPRKPDEPPPPLPDGLEFRQGYVVQLAMAGRFTFPELAIEATTPPVRTLHSEPSSPLEIRPPEAPAR